MYVSALGVAPMSASVARLAIPSPVLPLPAAAAQARPAQASATSFEIIPEAYRRLEAPVAAVGSTVSAGTVCIAAWPFVLLSESQVKATLDAITGPSGVGPAVVPALATVATSGGDALAKARSLAPSFLSVGFIRDEGVNQSVTRGYLWIAMSWAQDQPRIVAQRVAKAILGEALKAAGASFSTSPTKPSSGQVGTAQGALVAVADESDSAIEDAAKKSVLGLAQAAVAIAGALFGNITVSFTASRANSEFRSLGNTMANASRSIQESAAIVQQVDALSAQAMALPAEGQPAAGEALMQLKRKLLQNKEYILTASSQAAAAAQMCEAESSPETSQIAKGLRDQIVRDASAKLASYQNVPSVARKFAEASLWKRAQTQLASHFRGLSEQIAALCETARGLINNVTSVQQLVAQIDAAVAKLDYTYNQLRIDWWQRDWLGAPAYYWLGGGGLIVVGLVGWRVRARLKRRAEAAKGVVTKNRRRKRLPR